MLPFMSPGEPLSPCDTFGFILSVHIFGVSFERPYLIRGLNLMIAKSAKTTVFGQKSTKTAVFNQKLVLSQKLWIMQVLSLKLQNCWLVFSSKRGTKGKTSIFPWKTTKSMDLGQNPQILWFFGGFKVKNHISHSTFRRTSKHTLKSMNFCIVYPVDSFQDKMT